VFSCTYVGMPADNSIASCSGQISLDTTWHKTKDVSVAAFSFTADANDLIGNTGSTYDPLFVSENPIVTASNGAWPKPENIKGWSFDLYEVSNS